MTNNPTRNITKIARIRDNATGKYLEIIEFPISKSNIGKIKLSPSAVSEPKSLEKALRDAGAILPKDDQKLKELLTSVAKSDAPKDWIYAARTGWTRDKKAFVLVDRVIGELQDQNHRRQPGNHG